MKGNVAAIKLLKALEAENRDATPEEQRVLVKYVGWGGLSQALDDRRGEAMRDDRKWGRDENWEKKWGRYYKEIRELLTDEEFERAADSTANAHYTSLPVIKAMWDAVQRLGFTGGNVLEPAAGVGHFLGVMPDSIHSRSKQVAVELDSISARITAKLYPSARVLNKPFQEAGIPANSIDLAISNVPFTDETVDESEDLFGLPMNLHNFFLANMLRVVKPGGLVVAITTSNTMQSQPKQRQYLADHAELVGAIRLPNTAFKDNAGTEVTTDILFLRKPYTEVTNHGEPWNLLLKVQTKDGDEAEVNEYFVSNPDMVLGEHSMAGKMYARQSDKKEYTVMPNKGTPLFDQLVAAIEKLPEDLYGSVAPEESADADFEALGEAGDLPDGTLVAREEGIAAVQGGKFVDPSTLVANPTKDFPKLVKSYVATRDHYRNHVRLMRSTEATEADVEESQKQLNKLYDAHVKKYGPINGRATRALGFDPLFDMVAGLERLEQKGPRRVNSDWKKGAVFNKRTLYPAQNPTTAGNIEDAVKLSLAYRGAVDPQYLAELLGADPDQVDEQLHSASFVYRDPATGQWQPQDRYLSGNLRAKLLAAQEAVKEDPRYERNVSALEKAMPPRVGIAKIKFALKATWIPDTVYSRFATELFKTHTQVTYHKEADSWSVRARGRTPEIAASGYGTADYDATELVQFALNLRSPRVMRPGAKKDDPPVFDAEATMAATQAMSQLNEEFKAWVLKDAKASKEVEDAFNEAYTGFVRWKPDGSHMVFPGMNSEIKLRPYQKNAVWRSIVEGRALFAHAVGAGKTFTQIAAAMEMKRLGIARRPMIVVQNSTLPQFAAAARKMYPAANIVVADKDKMKAGDNRRRFLAGLAANDFDIVVIGHSQFDSLKVSLQYADAHAHQMIQELEDAIAEEVSQGERNSPSQKQWRKMIRKILKRLQQLTQQYAKYTDNTNFDDLAIDALFIDEAHRYKKPPFFTKLENLVGLNVEPSSLSWATFLKVREIQGRNRGRGVYLATGTPITNTMGEAWHMTNYIAPNLLEEFGTGTFDRFASSFLDIDEEYVINSANDYVPKKMVKQFTNAKQFQTLITSAWDVVPPDQVKAEVLAEGKPFPELKDGKRTLVTVPLSKSMKKVNDWLLKAALKFQNLSGKEKRLNSGVPVSVYGLGKIAAIDTRLVDPSQPDDPGSKLNAMVANAATKYFQTNGIEGTQLIFVDQIRPINMNYLYSFMAGEPPIFSSLDKEQAAKDLAEFEALEESEEGAEEGEPETQKESKKNLWMYEEIKRKLIEKGVPAEQIAFIHDAKNDNQRARLYDRVNAGEIRFLIGGTHKMGVGVNVQERVVALHHLDTPWMPMELEQREGRAVRFGNRNKEVEIFPYAMEDTIEAGVFANVARKARGVWQVMAGDVDEDEFEDPASQTSQDLDQMVALVSSDPLQAERIALDKETRGLKLERNAYYNRIAAARSSKESYEYEKRRVERKIPEQKELIKRAKAIDPNKFQAKIGDQEYTDPDAFTKDFDKLVDENFEKLKKKDRDSLVADSNKVSAGKSPKVLTFSLFGTVNGAVHAGISEKIVKKDGGFATAEETNFTTVLKLGDYQFANPDTKTGAPVVRRTLTLPNDLANGLAMYEQTLADAEKFIDEYGRILEQPDWPKEAEYKEKAERYTEVVKSLAAKKSKKDDPHKNDDPPTADARGFGLGGGTVTLERQWADRIGANPAEVADLLPDDPEQARRIAKAYGAKQKGAIETIKEFLLEFGRSWVRVNRHLPKSAEFAVANEFLRLLPEIPRASMDETARTVASIVRPLGPKQMALFSFALVARNLKANFIESQANPDNPLPKRFGMDEAAVDAWLAKLEAKIADTPDVQKALARRKLVLDDLVKKLVDAELLPPEALDKSETYFHQQVLSYLAIKQQAHGGASAELSKQGYRRQRTRGIDELGEAFDFNTFYLEAETEWMAKAIGDLEKAKRLDLLTRRYDRMQDFVRTANEKNFEKLVGGPDNVNRIKLLRRAIKNMEPGDAKTALMEERDKLDPTQPFRVRIAKAQSKLKKVIKDMAAPLSVEQLETSQYFQKVKELAAGPEDDDSTIWSRSLLKAVSDRREFIKAALGSAHETWQTILRKSPEFKLWQPKPGHYFYRALTIPAEIAAQVQAGMLDQVNVSAEELVPIMAMGSLREPVIFPAPLVDQLEEIHVAKRSQPTLVEKAAKAPLRYLKLAWLYYKPTNFVAYLVRNTLGDTEPMVASMSPGILQKLPQASAELRKYYLARRERGGREKLEVSENLADAVKYGVINASLEAQEIRDLAAIGPLRRFYSAGGDGHLRFAMDTLAMFRDFHEYYEQARRYAAYLYYLEKVPQGVQHYGASHKPVVDALRKQWSDKVAAAHLARELIGDYGNISIAGKVMRDYLAPFWSWTEINVKRWPMVALNDWQWAKEKGKGNKAATAAYMAGAAMAGGSFLAAAYFWNQFIAPFLFGGDPEEELSDVDRNTSHVILYRRSDGTLAIFRNPTASGEFMKLFGFNTLASLFPLWMEGKITTADVAQEWASGELSTAASMLRPEAKTPIELAIGASLYPDPTNPRAMPRDEILANLPGWVDEYRAAKGMILQDGSRARKHYWPKLWGVAVTDPKENALSEAHDLRTRFLKQKGKEQANPLRVSDTKKMKDAARADDFAAFMEAKAAYEKSGKSWKTFKASIGRLDPLETQLSEKEEREFIDEFLNDADRRKLDVARTYAADLKDRLTAWWWLAEGGKKPAASP